jgi:hypothetical protein
MLPGAVYEQEAVVGGGVEGGVARPVMRMTVTGGRVWTQTLMRGGRARGGMAWEHYIGEAAEVCTSLALLPCACVPNPSLTELLKTRSLYVFPNF